MGNAGLTWILETKASALFSFETRSITLPSSDGAVVLGTADFEARVMSVVMRVEGVDSQSLVQMHFLGCKWLVTVVVCGVVLCQHPTPNFSYRRCDKNGSLRARENVFDPHFHPPGIKEGAEQIRVQD
jgi:hypothetical protein